MANDVVTKSLNTRLSLRCDTLENWNSKGSDVVLLKGEAAVVIVNQNNMGDPVTENTRPQFLMKIGDGTTKFSNLPYISAKAADVYAWAKKSGISVVDEGTGSFITGMTWSTSDDSSVNELIITRGDYAFDGTYNATTNKVATVSTVTTAAGDAETAAKAYTDAEIAKLDSSATADTNKAISSITITDGKISSFEEIDIGDLDTNTKYKLVKSTAEGEDCTIMLQYQEKGTSTWTTQDKLDLSAILGDLFDLKMDKAGGTFTGNVAMGTGATLTVNTPTANGHAATKSYVDTAVSDVADDLAQEIEDRTAADTALDGKITAEATARENADTALGERIDDVEDEVEALTTALETEASTRATADTNLQAAITAEETRAKAEEAKALHSISGSDAIAVTAKSDFTQTVSLKIDTEDAGNVTLTQSENGLKAEVEIPEATVTGVKDGDKVLALSGTELTSTIALTYDSTNRKIKLTGIDDTLISEFSTDDFIKDGMLWGEKAFVATATSQEVSITKDSITQSHTFNGLTVGHQYLAFCFTDGAVTPTYSWDIVDLQDLVDVYTAGNGIDIANNVVSIKIDDASEDYLTVGADGLKISGIDDIADRVSDLEAKPGLDKVGTVTSVGADTGLKITGTSTVNPTVAIDDSVLFILNGGTADTNLN